MSSSLFIDYYSLIVSTIIYILYLKLTILSDAKQKNDNNELEQNIDDVLSSILEENAKETESSKQQQPQQQNNKNNSNNHNNQLKIQAIPALITAFDELTTCTQNQQSWWQSITKPESPNIYYDALDFEDDTESDDNNEINDIFSDDNTMNNLNNSEEEAQPFEIDLVDYNVDLSLFPKENECYPPSPTRSE